MAEPTSKDFDWGDLCRQFDGPPEKENAYEFSNGRVFKSPGEFGGVYQPEEIPN